MRKQLFKTPKKDKKLKIAKGPTTFRLYQETLEEVQRMSQAEHTDESEVLREIIRDWFRIKRIEALGRDQVEDPIRTIYERVLSQHIAPLQDAISQIKSMLATGKKSAANNAQLPLPDDSPDVMEALTAIRSLLEQTNDGVAESNSVQSKQFSETLRILKVIQAINSETFASTWTINDLFIRYLVEPTLGQKGKEPEDIQLQAEAERRGLRMEGLQKILDIEDKLELPKNLRLPKAVITTELFADLQSDSSSVF